MRNPDHCKSIHELDLEIWRMMSAAARAEPGQLAAWLGMSAEIIETIAAATTEELHSLASCSLICMAPTVPDSELISALAGPGETLLDEGCSATSAYWLTLREIGMYDKKLASLAFGVSIAVIEAVTRASYAQIRAMREIDLSLELRFAPELISLLLRRDSQALLRRVEQSTKKVPASADSQVPETPSRFEQRARARELAIQGYVTKIIILETGLSDKVLRGLYRELECEGYNIKNRPSRAIRGGSSIVADITSKTHASILMKLYRFVGGRSVGDAVSTPALESAYESYQAIVSELPAQLRRSGLTISDAWSLASELRSNDAFFESCRKCGAVNFISVNQKTSCECPFCHVVQNKHPRRAEAQLQLAYPHQNFHM